MEREAKNVIARDLVFVSYSHADALWLKRLRIHLKPFERNGAIVVWDDKQIQPGKLWRDEIRKALIHARVAVLLVSPDFLASDFIAEHELPKLLGVEKELTVLWIPVRPSGYAATEIGNYQAALDPQRSLAEMNEAEADRALVVAAEKIEQAYHPHPSGSEGRLDIRKQQHQSFGHTKLEANRQTYHPYRHYVVAALCLALLISVSFALRLPKRPTPAATPNEESSTNNALSRDELHRHVAELTAALFVRLQRNEGSIRVIADVPNDEGDPYVTSQTLAGVLAAPKDIVATHRERIIQGARFVTRSKNTTGGWGSFSGKPRSMLEPTAWATVMYARMAALTSVWPTTERQNAIMEARLALHELLRYQEPASGGFRKYYPKSDPPNYTYSTALALLALLELRRAGLVSGNEMAPEINSAISWLHDRLELSKTCRFRSNVTFRQQPDEPIGLTAQVLYTLTLAESLGFAVDIDRCESLFSDEMAARQLDFTYEDGFKTHDTMTGEPSQIRTLWYPWTVLWIQLASRTRGSKAPRSFPSLRNQLWNRIEFQRLIATFSTDETFRLAENLFAIGAMIEDN